MKGDGYPAAFFQYVLGPACRRCQCRYGPTPSSGAETHSVTKAPKQNGHSEPVTVSLAQNPPDVQSAKYPASNTARANSKPQIQFPLVGRGFPDAPSGTSPQGSTMLGKSVPITKFDRREGARSFRQQAPTNYKKSNANT